MNLSIKNVPEEIVQRLRQRAVRRASIASGRALAIIEEAIQSEGELTPRELLAEVRRVGLRTPANSAENCPG